MLPEISKILYATDLGGGDGEKAYRMALAMANRHQARIIMLHVLEPVTANMEGLLRQALTDEEIRRIKDQGVESLRSEVHQQIEAFCDAGNPDPEGIYPGGEPLIEIAEGAPAEVILAKADEHAVDMIVMGTRTHSAIGQVLGSIANKVIHHSRIPVLVCPL